MRLPVIRGIIRRRLLVNFRVDPEVMSRNLPARFRPKLQRGSAIAGICLIRLEEIRPKVAPAAIGLASENAAHRVAVCWQEDDGADREGVYIARRDTSSLLNHIAGGRVFPGEHHLAKFDVTDDGDRIMLTMTANDGDVRVAVRARAASSLPSTSVFRSIEEAARFFEGGAVGYSVTSEPNRLDGIRLVTPNFPIAPLAVDEVFSSLLSDPSRFPVGSVEFDCALVMRDVAHEWHEEPDLFV